MDKTTLNELLKTFPEEMKALIRDKESIKQADQHYRDAVQDLKQYQGEEAMLMRELIMIRHDMGLIRHTISTGNIALYLQKERHHREALEL